MPWIKFTEDFDWHVKPNVTIAYTAGQRYLVPQACEEAAIKAGKAVASPPESKPQAPRSPHDARR